MAWLQVLICRMTSDALMFQPVAPKGLRLPFIFLGFLLGQLMMPPCSGQAPADEGSLLIGLPHISRRSVHTLVGDAC